jgi:hypothetical protein
VQSSGTRPSSSDTMRTWSWKHNWRT